jgi:hypothetical protein
MTDSDIKPTRPITHRIVRWAEAARYDDLAAQAERWGHFRMAITHRETAAELRRLSEADKRGPAPAPGP